MNPSLSFSFLALFHTSNDCGPWGGSERRAKGVKAVGWCEAMSTICCAIREVASVPQQLFLAQHHPLDEIIFVNILSDLQGTG